MRDVRIPNADHEARPWRIRAVAPEFTLEDVWALPVHGRAEDFRSLVDLIASGGLTTARSRPARALWRARRIIGGWLGWDDVGDPLPIPGSSDTSLIHRLPADLRGTADDVRFASLPFEPLYRTEVEFAAEASNKTVHGVIHLVWVEEEGGDYRGRMAVYVKPRGRLGGAYMAFIRPFRHRVVYPALLRQIGIAWNQRATAR